MHGGNHATALFPARLCSQRRAMAGVTSRRDGAFADEEPSGFVFEEANTEREESLGASALLVAAGAPVLVLDGADDVKVWQCACSCFALAERRKMVRKQESTTQPTMQ